MHLGISTASLGRTTQPWRDFSISEDCQYLTVRVLPNTSSRSRRWIRCGRPVCVLTTQRKSRLPELSSP